MKDLNEELEQLKNAQLYRTRRVNASAPATEIVIDGKKVLSFCSNDYLGLANHTKIKQAFSDGVSKWGSGSGAAHLVCGHHSAHQALEEELAEFTNRPRALLFSTGYMANLGIASALVKRGDTILEDRYNHASLLDAGLLSGARLIRFPHADLTALRKKLESRTSGKKLLMVDGVFSMDGDLSALPEIVKICQKHDSCLAVDDAHGLGVLGNTGAGTLEHFSLNNVEVPILMGTLGKAFGCFGAFVAGDETIIETLIQKARTYIYTTALPPAIAEATRASLKIVQKENWRREHLNNLITHFRKHAEILGLKLLGSNTPIQPIILGNADKALKLSDALYKKGILATAIRPPTVPKNTARIRITFSATHSIEQVNYLLESLEKCFAQHSL